MNISTLGRRIYKLTQLLEQPKMWKLYPLGVEPSTYREFNQSWLKKANIKTVIDIGANIGQFTFLIHGILPNAKIYAFEPLPECFSVLKERTATIPEIQVFNLGLGSQDTVLTFHRNPYADSSSFREMADLHRNQFPFTSGQEKLLEIPVKVLDSFSSQIDLQDNILIKIDVQGYEDEVLNGGANIISQAHMVIMEISFAPLYEKTSSFDELYNRMKQLGFEYKGSIGQLIGPIDGAILQCDALFIKKSSI